MNLFVDDVRYCVRGFMPSQARQTIYWVRPGVGGRVCVNCLRDRKLEMGLREAGHSVVNFPIYLPLAEKTPHIFYGALRAGLGDLYAPLSKLPAWVNRIFDTPALLRLVAQSERFLDPAAGASLTLATLTGNYDPRFDSEFLDAAHDMPAPNSILVSTPLLARQGEILHSRWNVPWHCLVGGEDHWLDALPLDIAQASLREIYRLTASCSTFFGEEG